MIMNGLEGHMQEFGLYPKILWRAIGRFWAAAQLGYSSVSVQSWLGGKKKKKKTNGEKDQFESCCNSPVRNDKNAYQVSGDKMKNAKPARMYWEAQVATLTAHGDNRQYWSNYKRRQI